MDAGRPLLGKYTFEERTTAMTQTNEWGVDETTDNAWGQPEPEQQEWGADEPDANPWGTDTTVEDNQWGADTPAEDNQWGEDATADPNQWGDEPPQATAWGETEPQFNAEPADDQWSDPTDDFQAAYASQDEPGAYSWSEEDYEQSPLGHFEAETPERERKIPTKWLIIGGGVIAVIFVAVFLFMNLGGDSSANDQEPQETQAPADPGVPPEVQQFEPFAQGLQEALNNRDPEAYHELIAEESRDVVPLEAAEEAIDALPAGAQYEVKLNNGSAAGPTATVKLTLVRTLAGDVDEQPMSTELAKEGEDWRMVVRPDDQ